MANPQSRNEEILQSIVGKTTYDKSPQSREEVLLLEIKDLIQGGGTSDVQGLVLTMNSSTYVITAYLIDGEGQQVGDSQTIDIPLEATIVDASYNNLTKTITFTLTSGAYLTVPIGDIIYGLQPLIDAQHKLPANLVDDTQGRIKFTYTGTQAQYAQDAATIPAGTPVMITDDTDMDTVPTSGSSNPVTSDGIKTALDGKQDTIDSSHKVSADHVDDTSTTNKFVSAADKTSIGTSATKLTGIDSTGSNKIKLTNGKTLWLDDTAPTTGVSDGDIWLADTYELSPLNHNGIFRGKNLTNVYTVDEIYAKVHDGSFDDLYLGDYFTVSITTDIMTKYTGATFESGVDYYEMDGGTDVTARTWTLTPDTEPQSGKTYATKLTKTENITLMFAAFDYYYNIGDTALTTHHAILIPRGAGFATTAKMNLTNTTAGGYYGSDMHQITLPCYAKSLKTALGNHLLSHKTWLTTTVNTSTPSMAGAGLTGAASASAWETTELQLMDEVQLYGSTVLSSSAYDVGVDNEKLPVFNFINPVHFGLYAFWLRSVVSSTNFAFCSLYGYAYYTGASTALDVRPIIVFG